MGGDLHLMTLFHDFKEFKGILLFNEKTERFLTSLFQCDIVHIYVELGFSENKSLCNDLLDLPSFRKP